MERIKIHKKEFDLYSYKRLLIRTAEVYESSCRSKQDNTNNIEIVDGWYYKFWARLEAQNIDIDYLKVAFKRIIKPDHVFLLSTDVKKIIDRKNDIKKYEQGSHIGLQGNEGFVAFQNITAKNLRKYAEAYNWTVINNNDDIINTVNAIDEMIKQELLIGDE